MTMIDTADRRRLGTALVVYGALGTLLFLGLLIGLVLAGSLLSDAPDKAAAGLDKVVAVLDSTGETLTSVETTLGGATQTLTTTATTIDGAATTLTDMGGTLDGIGQALTAFSILGAAPLATVGTTVGNLGDQVAGVGQQIGGLSASLTANASDVAELTVKLGTLRADLAELEDALVSLDLASFGRTIALVRYAMLAIVAWLALGSVGLTWFGWRLRQVPRDAGMKT